MLPRDPAPGPARSPAETCRAAGQNSRVSEVSSEATLRLRRRYPPPRVPRQAKVALIAIGVAITLGWLVWAALVHATPAVSATVSAYEVADNSISVTVTVDRPDPSKPVTCRVIAQAADFQTVGERLVPVEATPAKVVNVQVKVTTLRRSTSASVKGCTLD